MLHGKAGLADLSYRVAPRRRPAAALYDETVCLPSRAVLADLEVLRDLTQRRAALLTQSCENHELLNLYVPLACCKGLVVHDWLLLGVVWAAALPPEPGQHVGAVPYARALQHAHGRRKAGFVFCVFDALVRIPADESEHFSGSE